MGSVIMTSDAYSVSSAATALACILSQTITMLDYATGGSGQQFLVKPSLIPHQNNETNHPFLIFLVQTGSSSLSYLLQKILSRLMMEDCTSQWNLSQPLYPLLILMDDKVTIKFHC